MLLRLTAVVSIMFCRYSLCAVALILLCWTDSTDGHYHKRLMTYRNRGRYGSYSRTSGSHGAGPSECLPDTPQIPNVLQPMKVDPYRLLGRWYSYIQYYKGIGRNATRSANIITTFNSLAHDTLQPATGSSAVLFEQLFGYWDLDTVQCAAPIAALGYLTREGTESAVGYYGPEAFTMDNSVVLATDYNTYALHYACGIYKMDSGLCDYPSLYVFTRTRPDQLSSAAVDTVARAINGLLSQYCVTADMFLADVWVPSSSDCPFVIPTDPCYLTLRQAHLDVAGAST